MNSLDIIYRNPVELCPSPRNARTHSKEQIKRISRSISTFSFIEPVILDADDQIIVGHARTEAAKMAGVQKIPTVRIKHLSAKQIRAYRVASNRLAELAGWDEEILELELGEFDALALDFGLTDIGFDTAEFDRIFGAFETTDPDEEPAIPKSDPNKIVSTEGDLWLLGKHKLYAGDFTKPASMTALMGDERANMILADVSYNLKIPGVVSGLGKVRHENFMQGSGEMSNPKFTRLLTVLFRNLVSVSMPGSLHYVFMDFRSPLQLLRAGDIVYDELKAIISWVKTSGAMGSLYWQRCESVAVFKHGDKPHVNNIELGRHGRNRTTVWEYAGLNGFQRSRDELLTAHPIPKPLALCVDAILDVNNRGDIVLTRASVLVPRSWLPKKLIDAAEPWNWIRSSSTSRSAAFCSRPASIRCTRAARRNFRISHPSFMPADER